VTRLRCTLPTPSWAGQRPAPWRPGRLHPLALLEGVDPHRACGPSTPCRRRRDRPQAFSGLVAWVLAGIWREVAVLNDIEVLTRLVVLELQGPSANTRRSPPRVMCSVRELNSLLTKRPPIFIKPHTTWTRFSTPVGRRGGVGAHPRACCGSRLPCSLPMTPRTLLTPGAFNWEDGDYAVRCWRQAAGGEVVVTPTPAAAPCSTTVERVQAVRQSFRSGWLERIASRTPVHPARSQIVSHSSDKPTEEAS
jgi:hypothetical protein